MSHEQQIAALRGEIRRKGRIRRAICRNIGLSKKGTIYLTHHAGRRYRDFRERQADSKPVNIRTNPITVGSASSNMASNTLPYLMY